MEFSARKIVYAIALAGLLPLMGCSNTPLSGNKESGVFKPPVEIEVSPVDIKLVPHDPMRIDPILPTDFALAHDKVLTGGYWTKVFVGNDEARVSFVIDSAHWSIKGGYTATYTYNVAGHVTCMDTDFPINVTGRGSSGWVALAPMSDALRAAITEAAMKATSIASICKSTDAAAQQNRSSSKYDDLRELDSLLQDGIITQEEFEKEKRKILDGEE